MSPTDFLSIRDFAPKEIQRLLEVAQWLKANPQVYSGALRGKTLAMIFEKPSLRTRVTFDVGIQQLGGFSVYLSPAEINLGKRESVYDVAKNLERMVQGIMIRTFAHDIVERMAEYAAIPIINGLTDYSHPCQAMADYLTHDRGQGAGRGAQGRLRRRRQQRRPLADVHRRAARGARHGGHAAGLRARRRRDRLGAGAGQADRRQLPRGPRPGRGRRGADAVYTDVWASMGQEAEAEQRKRTFLPYQVNGELFGQAKPDAIFLHCLPAHRGEEVTDEVIDSPRSVVFQQAENRLHAQKAILLELMK